MTDAILKDALKGQYHAALAMLGEAIRLCPDELWTQGTRYREFWQIAYHAVYYGQLYIEQTSNQFVPWDGNRDSVAHFENEATETPYSKPEIIAAWNRLVAMVDEKIDALDLSRQESGFYWYANFPKLDHILLSLRHVQEHAGQLRDRLLEAGFDPNWISRGKEPTGGWD